MNSPSTQNRTTHEIKYMTVTANVRFTNQQSCTWLIFYDFHVLSDFRNIRWQFTLQFMDVFGCL